MSIKIEKSLLSSISLGTWAIIMTASLAWASTAHAATANISASATIVPPAGVAERSDMRFAGFVAGTTPRTITLSVPSSLPVEVPTSATPVESGVGAVQISGPPSSSFSASTPRTTLLSSGDNTITLERIELRYGAGGTAGTVRGAATLTPAGTGTIVIGGALNAGVGQTAGAYAGSLVISVDY